jgi:adenylate cyclase
MQCVEVYFDCRLIFMLRGSYYEEHYGFVPRFKAGLHRGLVTAVEVGEIKRDIAYHGDTLNTTSRIQSKCKEYKSDLLISGEIERRISWPKGFEREFVGAVSLRGKGSPVDLFNVQVRSA